MTSNKVTHKKNKKTMIYVKPVLTYEQVVEITDERILQLEKLLEQKQKSKKNQNKK